MFPIMFYALIFFFKCLLPYGGQKMQNMFPEIHKMFVEIHRIFSVIHKIFL